MVSFMTEICVSPLVSNDALNELFATAWANHISSDFEPILSHSLLYVCAYDNGRLVGFVNVAWDGGIHGFILDTTVHADYQRRGIGRKLVEAAIESSRAKGIEWLHVDYELRLDEFYKACGFRHTAAGLLNLK
jgi:ribosomal protein S18 acetylase RimI-like enzyme